MNTKQNKKLRREALIQAVEQNVPYVDYDFKTYKKVYQSLDGRYHSYVVYTAFMKDCQKKLYRQLKKEFRAGKA